jgi:hypothetical protein
LIRSSASSGVKRYLNVSVAVGGAALAEGFAGAETAGFFGAGAAEPAEGPPDDAEPASPVAPGFLAYSTMSHIHHK